MIECIKKFQDGDEKKKMCFSRDNHHYTTKRARVQVHVPDQEHPPMLSMWTIEHPIAA